MPRFSHIAPISAPLKLNRLLTFAALSLTSFSAIAADITVIHAGELLVIPGEKPLKRQSLIIEDGKITAVKAGFIQSNSVSGKVEYIDLKNNFVLPGLMDMHVHLQGELGPNNDSEALRMSDADVAMQSAYFAKKTLLAGFTTVRDLGAKPE